jgi:hypothetical protein
MTIQDLPRHIELKTTMILHTQKQADTHTLRGTPAGLLRERRGVSISRPTATTPRVLRLCKPLGS